MWDTQIPSSATIITIWVIRGYPFFLFRIPMHTTQETLAGAFTVLTKFLALVVMWASVRFPI